MLTCRDATRLISQALDEPLPRGKRIALRVHLLICHLCRRYARQIRSLDRIFRAFAARAPEAAERLGSLDPAAKSRMKAALRGE